jgi:hypothetical protein
MIKKLMTLLSAISVCACATQQPKATSEAVLFNPVINASSMELSVLSNGCTSANDFYLKVSGDEVELRRIKEDICRAAPGWLRLSFEYPFGDKPYRIKNRVRFNNRILR